METIGGQTGSFSAPLQSNELQVVSDLHLEAPKAYDFFTIAPKAPYLALLGDIGNATFHFDDLLLFLSRLESDFQSILLVPGNHEAYSSDWPKTMKALHDAAAVQKNLVVLDRVQFRPPGSPGTVILGCSLFSHVPPERCEDVSRGLNDFGCISKWTVDDHNAAHRRDLDWLNSTVGELESDSSVTKIIILTHWSPSADPRAADPKHAGSPISCAFSSDLSREVCFLSPKVNLWAFGHTHYNCDFEMQRANAGPLRLATNQRGYYFAQAEGFDSNMTVEL